MRHLYSRRIQDFGKGAVISYFHLSCIGEGGVGLYAYVTSSTPLPRIRVGICLERFTQHKLVFNMRNTSTWSGSKLDNRTLRRYMHVYSIPEMQIGLLLQIGGVAYI